MRVARALLVHPREITLALERPGETARNVFGGVIEEMVPEPPAGELMRVSLSPTPPLIAAMTRGAVESLGASAGNASVRVLQDPRSRCNPMTHAVVRTRSSSERS